MLIVAKEFISMSSSFKSLDHILSCYNNVPSSDTATDAIQVPHITSWSSSSSDSDEDAVNDEYVTRITPMLIPVCFKNETTSKGVQQGSWADTRLICVQGKNFAPGSRVPDQLRQLEVKGELGSNGERVAKLEGCIFALVVLAAVMSMF